MSKYQSSMRAALTDAECERIDEQWLRLRFFVEALPAQLDPADMLPAMTDIVMACHDCRMAISEGWHSANLRRFPPTPSYARPPRGARIFRMDDPAKLHNALLQIMGETGLSEEALQRLLNTEKGPTE